jgi:dienelactone hydrolase
VRTAALAAGAALALCLAGCVGVTSSARQLVTSADRAGGHGPPYAVGERVITLVDPSRTVTFPGHAPQPRTLVTVVRYPAQGPPGAMDIRDAAPDRASGPFPLVVFGHGFAVTPATYYRLLRAWAQAGYVVAAPVFPLENANAPGGPNEADLVNQPRDMSFVISQLLAANASRYALLADTIDPRQIAVSGQSDGGETALAVSYDKYYRDSRVRAAVILSGAEIPSVASLAFPAGAPPLLAAQGTADVINRPANTYAFFDIAHRPKFLLELIGAPHLPPYTSEQPQLGIVESVTIAFLDRYLNGERAGITEMKRAGDRPGTAVLVARP